MLDSHARLFDVAAIFTAPQPVRTGQPDGSHPLAQIRRLVDVACQAESAATARAVATRGMTAGRLIRAALLQSLYSYGCDEQLMEQLRYNALYRWFVGLRSDELCWETSSYTRELATLRSSEAGAALFRSVLIEAHAYAALVPGRFRIDQPLLARWTSAAASSFASEGQPCTGQPRQSRLERARAVILRRIGDPSLTPEAIADELCMSRRALYLLFGKHGLTPTRAIRELRLECCLKLLGDPRHRHRKITDIAMDYGFEHATSFSRQFKLRYGISPNEARAAPVAMPGIDWHRASQAADGDALAAH